MVKIIAEGKTNQSFKKLIASAPIKGITRLSFKVLKELKLKSMQKSRMASLLNSFNSDLSTGKTTNFKKFKILYILKQLMVN
jgi:hypothetical protein